MMSVLKITMVAVGIISMSLPTVAAAEDNITYVRVLSPTSFHEGRHDDGIVRATLTDGLNKPLAGVAVRIEIMAAGGKGGGVGGDSLYDVVTNGDGTLELIPDLPEGEYQADLIFDGVGDMLPTRESYDVRIPPCPSDSRLVIHGSAVPIGAEVSFDIARECGRQKGEWIVTAGASSKRVSMDAGRLSASFSITPVVSAPGDIYVEADPLGGDGASLSAKIRVYDPASGDVGDDYGGDATGEGGAPLWLIAPALPILLLAVSAFLRRRNAGRGVRKIPPSPANVRFVALGWIGGAKHPQQHETDMAQQYADGTISRRDYAISCFESVCSIVTGTDVHWGLITPDELPNIAAQNKVVRDAESLRAFCNIVSSSAFDGIDPTDTQLSQLYDECLRYWRAD